MKTMAALTLTLVLAAGATVSAHEVTYKGTVVSLEAAKYAQPGGGTREVQELEVRVIDAKTKKASTKVFTIVDATRVLRAGKRMKLAEASVVKGNPVEVVVDHDKPGDVAIEIRLTTAR
ncbi:MAG TPA: hypothetical protein VMN81_06460 [Vicinamibacterales bacterium]|nr:hypothetical protein [Vicinamibacterales bacterium]